MAERLLLITGATGLVGSHVAERAVQSGWRVRALVRAGSPERAFLRGLGVEEVEGDLAASSSPKATSVLGAAMQGVTHVVHAAAAVGDWGTAAYYEALNVEATKAMVEAALAQPMPPRFVHVSSLGVYEPRHHYGTTEDAPPASGRRALDHYTRTKAEAEAIVMGAARSRGLPGVAVRPGFIYGPRDRQVLPRLATVLKEGRFLFIGDGRRVLDHVGVRNVGEVVFLALTKPEAVGGVFNVTDDPVVDRVTYVGTVARLLGLPMPTRHVPEWAARPAALAMDRAARFLRRTEPPLLSLARYKFLALNLQFSIERAQRVLGYRPVAPFETGMAEAVAWWRSQPGGRAA
jgi:nucleoside-diphosphate-sugar epimerase